MKLYDFLRKNFNEKVTIYINNKPYQSIGNKFYSKMAKEGMYSEVIKYGSNEDYFKADESNPLIAYITIPELNFVSCHLYGGKSIFGGSSPYELETRRCEKTNLCSLYQKGMCSAVRRLSNDCPNIIQNYKTAGYKSQKGRELYEEYYATKDKNVLKEFDGHFWIVGDEYYFYIPYLGLMKHNETGEYTLSSKIPYHRENEYSPVKYAFSILKEKATKEFFEMIFNAQPRALFGGIITDYQNKIIPRLKIDILKHDPELAKELGIKEINYVGKKAVLKTLKPGITVWDKDKKYHLYWNGETVEILNSDILCSISWIGNYHSGTIKLIPSDRLVVVIEDNDWVLPETEFKNY